MGGAYHRQCQRLAGISSTWARLLARLVLIVYRDGSVAKEYGDCEHRSLTNVHRWTTRRVPSAGDYIFYGIHRDLVIRWENMTYKSVTQSSLQYCWH